MDQDFNLNLDISLMIIKHRQYFGFYIDPHAIYLKCFEDAALSTTSSVQTSKEITTSKLDQQETRYLINFLIKIEEWRKL